MKVKPDCFPLRSKLPGCVEKERLNERGIWMNPPLQGMNEPAFALKGYGRCTRLRPKRATAGKRVKRGQR